MLSAILAVTPFLARWAVSLSKRTPAINNLDDKKRLHAIRFVTALFAVILGQALFMLGGDPLTTLHFEELFTSFFIFLSTIGAHDLMKKK